MLTPRFAGDAENSAQADEAAGKRSTASSPFYAEKTSNGLSMVDQATRELPLADASLWPVPEITNGCFVDAKRVNLRLGPRAGSENREQQLRVDFARSCL
jgi:hypothetical protein